MHTQTEGVAQGLNGFRYPVGSAGKHIKFAGTRERVAVQAVDLRRRSALPLSKRASRLYRDLVRKAIRALADKVVTPSLILKKLSAYRQQNSLAAALREIGRIERAIFTGAALCRRNSRVRKRLDRDGGCS
ncbi:TnpA family transposase [Rhizobium herbae]|uniref:TnpA family transposase n=1 Tax=Rhizobium herbae TaxID=508661 RepID=A0ABS4EWP8_9HYPH|nr:TnpA family transposase [Rhizobium herbae]